MNAEKFSNLARNVNPAYPSNRMIVTFMPVVFVAVMAAGIAGGEKLSDVVVMAVNVTLAVFIAWVLGRELDPDNPITAVIAAPLTVIALLLLNVQAGSNIIALGVLIMAVRVVNRSSGLPLLVSDAIAILLLTAWAATTDLWIVGGVMAVAFFADSQLPEAHLQSRYYAGIALVITLIIPPLTQDLKFVFEPSILLLMMLLTVFTVQRMVIPKIPEQLESVGDRTGEGLNRARVVYGINLMGLALLILAAWQGESGATAILPLWMAFVGLLIAPFTGKMVKG